MPNKKIACHGGCGKDIRPNDSGLCADCYRQQRDAIKPGARSITTDALHRRANDAQTPEDRLREDLTITKNALADAQAIIKRQDTRVRFEDRLASDLSEYLRAHPYRPFFTKAKARKGQSNDHEMVAAVSDAHYPEVVDPDAAFGLRYDGATCRARLQYLRDKIIGRKDLRSYPVRKLTLAVNGDMVSGDIHEELTSTNEKPMTQAVIDMGYMLAEFGSDLAQEFPEVQMIVMPGNHPRTTKKPQYKQKWNNWEYVMGHFVHALARDKFTVTVPRDLVYRHKVFDFNIGLTHGDGVKLSSAFSMPLYTMKRRQDSLQSLLKTIKQQQLDGLIYGHFHQYVYVEGQGCWLFINGSIKGGDEFSIGTGYSAQPAIQGLLTIHPTHGVADISRFDLSHVLGGVRAA
jgi:predicted phosphodiesterase